MNKKIFLITVLVMLSGYAFGMKKKNNVVVFADGIDMDAQKLYRKVKSDIKTYLNRIKMLEEEKGNLEKYKLFNHKNDNENTRRIRRLILGIAKNGNIELIKEQIVYCKQCVSEAKNILGLIEKKVSDNQEIVN